MADTVNVQVLHDGSRKIAVNMTGISDGTGEGGGVTKIDLSATSHLSTAAAGSAATPGSVYTISGLVLDEIWWSVEGWDGVKLLADRTTDHVMSLLPAGEGYKDYRPYSGLVDLGTGGTGDIVLYTYGTAALNNSYAILAIFRKKWSR